MKAPVLLAACFLLGFAGSGCQSGPKKEVVPLTIIVGETAVHERPDRLSPPIARLSYGSPVFALYSKLPPDKSAWTEIQWKEKGSAFVRSDALGTAEIASVLLALAESLSGKEVQAVGVTTTPTFLRLEPGRQGKPVEKLAAGTAFAMYQRQAILLKKSDDAYGLEKPRKEIWYKVKLKDGRVGYIFSKNFKLEPPSAISHYANSRKPMAWKSLGTAKSPDAGGAEDYVVAYATPDSDFGADFNRIEIYSWKNGGYQTAFVRGSLRGILPLKVVNEEGTVFIEITELDPARQGHVIVSRYQYGYPYKKVGSVPEQREAGLH